MPLSQKLIVGGVAGVIGAATTFPIDIVKTRLQSQAPNSQGVWPYKGPLDCFRQIITRDGPRGLYRGLPPTLVGIIPEKAIKLAMNDFLREAFEDEHSGEISIGKQILAAAGAGTTQVIATNPMEIVKIRLQTQHKIAQIDRLNAVQVIQSLGLRGLYKGTSCTLLRDVPYGIVFFPTYAALKAFTCNRETQQNSIFSVIGSGATAGAVAAALVTPADVIKTRFQMKGARFTNLYECSRHILQKEGYGAFIKGMGPRMMVQAPLFGITLLAFELQKQYMGAI